VLDLQAVFVRDVARIVSVDFVSVFRIEGVDRNAVVAVHVNGVESRFISSLAQTPDDLINGDTQAILVTPPEGVLFESISDVTVTQEYTLADGSVSQLTKAIDIANNLSLDPSVLRVEGEDFTKVVDVWVNAKKVNYTVLSKRYLLCTIPTLDRSIETIDVISDSKTVNRQSFFEYLLQPQAKTTSGTFKLVQQFIKVLMTSTGSDVFDPGLGGDLQNWVGSKVIGSNPHALAVKTTLTIQLAAAHFQARQAVIQNLPGSEKLAQCQVVNVGASLVDPTALDIGLRLVTYDQQTAIMSMMVGTLENAIQSLNPDAITG